MNCGSILVKRKLGTNRTSRAMVSDAFVGRMLQLQRFVNGEESQLISSVQDAWFTMALVQATYISSASPMTPVATLSDLST